MENLVFVALTYFILLLQWSIQEVSYNDHLDNIFQKYLEKNNK